MEIKVGDYVRIDNDFRTICIGIGKVVNKNQDTIYVKMSNNDLPISFNINSIVKYSKNIIDLIEKGDYVNGYRVDEITINTKTNEKTLLTLELDTLLNILFHSSIGYIKSIVTHQQFSSIEYKVESEEK